MVTKMLELRILNGLHQGASLGLDTEGIILGSCLDADIEILDPGVENRHCTIEYIEPRSQWIIRALDGEIYSGFENMRVNSVAITKDLIIKMGAIHIGFFESSDVWDLQKYSRPELMQLDKQATSRFSIKKYRLHIGTVAAIGSLLTYSMADAGSTRDGSSQHSAATTAAAAIAAPVMPVEKFDKSNVAALLENMLRQRGLLQSVAVKQDGDAWVLSGELNEDGLATIARMTTRFVSQYPDVTLKNATTAINRTLPFKIKSVSSGMYAHILTTDDERVYVGEALKGYTLKKIEKNKIYFSGDTDVELLW